MELRTVVVLNDYCHVNGGASKVAIDEAVGLASAGVDVLFFGACGPVADALPKAGVRVHCLEQKDAIESGCGLTSLLRGLWNRQAGVTMQAILNDLDPERTVVHLHGYTKALTTAPLRAALSRDFSVVCTLHDYFAACPNGAFFHYPQRRPCGERALSVGCVAASCDKRHYAHKLYRVLRAWVQRLAGRMPGGIRDYIGLSAHSEATLKPYLPAGARVHRLSNPIETVRALPVEVVSNRTILFIGRLDVEKGVEMLLQAAKQADAAVTFVGDGPLRAQVLAAGHRVTGWLDPHSVRGMLERARCLVFPSLWFETYGLVVDEAAARGVPAIVSDVTAAAERIGHGVSGWRVKAGEVDAWAEALSAAKDDKQIAEMGREAYRRFWADALTFQHHTDSLQAIYGEVLAARLSREEERSDASK